MFAELKAAPPVAGFATTHWTVVLQAADIASPDSGAALGELYKAYFYPLYAFVRRKGNSEHDAQDVLHDFFCALIERNYLKSVARERWAVRPSNSPIRLPRPPPH
jgi:hypothetical protein